MISDNRSRHRSFTRLRWVGGSLVLALVLTACGGDIIVGLRMDNTEAQIEAMTDPVGFARLGVDLVDEETGKFLHEGGFVVSWQANGETPETVLDAFVPVLMEAGYRAEINTGQACTNDALRLFMVDSTDNFGSGRLFYDENDGIVRLLAGWDVRPVELIDWIDSPTCAALGS